MKKVALYLRVSTLDQTVENQKMRLIEYANQHGYEYDIYEEVESSRRTRPVKQALLQKLRNGEYFGCVVYKIDRWARTQHRTNFGNQRVDRQKHCVYLSKRLS